MIVLWLLTFLTITVCHCTLELTFKEIPNLEDFNITFYSFVETKNNIFLTQTYSYASSCVLLLPSNVTTKSLKFNFKCFTDNFCLSNDEQRSNASSLSRQELCPMLGTIDRVGIFFTSRSIRDLNALVYTIYIVIEGCYIYDSKNEKVDVIWTISNYSSYDCTVVQNYFNNTISSDIHTGEIIFGDGSCSKLCQTIDCEQGFESISKYTKATFSLGFLHYFAIVFGIISVMGIFIFVFYNNF